MATAWELMCQPSDSNGIELNYQSAMISTSIISAVIHIAACAALSSVASRVEYVVLHPVGQIFGAHGLASFVFAGSKTKPGTGAKQRRDAEHQEDCGGDRMD